MLVTIRNKIAMTEKERVEAVKMRIDVDGDEGWAGATSSSSSVSVMRSRPDSSPSTSSFLSSLGDSSKGGGCCMGAFALDDSAIVRVAGQIYSMP